MILLRTISYVYFYFFVEMKNQAIIHQVILRVMTHRHLDGKSNTKARRNRIPKVNGVDMKHVRNSYKCICVNPDQVP